MLFTGTYRRALDDKLRLPFPKPLREGLSPGARLYLTPGFDGCLAIYPEAAFLAVAERLAAASPAAREIREYSRLFFSQAVGVIPDRQWRFRVHAELIRWAGIAGEVMIVGVRDRAEAWAPERWRQYVADSDQRYDQLAEIALATQPLRDASAEGGARQSIPSEEIGPRQPR